MFEEIEARRLRLDAYRPFDEETRRRLDKVFVPFFIYNSNAIEGNTLSLGATIAIVEEGKLPGGGHSEQEYLEVKGQQAAYEYLRRAIDERFPITERLVREFHQLLTDRLDKASYAPGSYKPRDNRVVLPDGTEFPYVSHVDTPAAMQSLIAWLTDASSSLHPVELAAQFHYRFILIHPFLDGNGRTVRLLTNLILAQRDFVMAPFRFKDRRDVYLAALRAVDGSIIRDELRPDHPDLNFFPFVAYLEQELLFAYDQAFDVLEGRLGVTPQDLVRRLAGLEANVLAGQGIAHDEAERARLLAQRIEAVAEEIFDVLSPVTAEANEAWTELVCALRRRSGTATEVLGPVGAGVRRRIDPSGEVRGHVAQVSLTIRRSPNASVPLEGRPTLNFLVFANPHKIIIFASRGMEPKFAELEIGLDESATPPSDLQQFVLDRTSTFVAHAQAQLAGSTG